MDNIDNGQKMHVTVEWMAKKYKYQVLYRGNMLENKKNRKNS